MRGSNLLMFCLLLVGFLFVSAISQADNQVFPNGECVLDSFENTQVWVPFVSVQRMKMVTSVPFAGETTPVGIMIATSSTNPPVGFNGGELYLYVDDIRGWEQK